MKSLLFLAAFIVFGCSAGGAESRYAELWQKGNEYYQQKQYDSAATYFEQIAAGRPLSAEVYYNLGNTYYRLNKVAYAILNYERALQINPGYREAKENLLLAQGRISNHIPVADEIFFIKWWQDITHPDKATTWSVCALITFVLIMLTMIARRLGRNVGSRVPVQLTGFLWLAFTFFILLAFTASRDAEVRINGVVMQADAPLMNSELKGKPVVLVPEGTKVRIRADKGNWVEVSLPDGRTGWLQQSLLTKI